jgi:hypothetical protein
MTNSFAAAAAVKVLIQVRVSQRFICLIAASAGNAQRILEKTVSRYLPAAR